MCTSEQVSTGKQLGLRPKTMESEERRRRLRKVYDILLVLAEQAETAAATPNIIGHSQRIEKRLSVRWELEQALMHLPMPREGKRAGACAPALAWLRPLEVEVFSDTRWKIPSV